MIMPGKVALVFGSFRVIQWSFSFAGVAAFVALFRVLVAAEVDWPFALVLSLIPLLGLAAYVHLMVNGKAPSYAVDVLLFFLWCVKVRTYLAGALDRPPQFWVKGQMPRHPSEF